jgi:hypothetical protein
MTDAREHTGAGSVVPPPNSSAARCTEPMALMQSLATTTPALPLEQESELFARRAVTDEDAKEHVPTAPRRTSRTQSQAMAPDATSSWYDVPRCASHPNGSRTRGSTMSARVSTGTSDADKGHDTPDD